MNKSTRIRAAVLAVALAACGGASQPPVANTGGTPPAGPACELPPEPPRVAAPSMCTEMACLSGYRVHVSPDEGWPAGQYTFELTADGKHQICTGSLPIADCDAPAMRCTGDDVGTIQEMSCGGDPALQAFDGVDLTGMPCDVQVKISRDGVVLADKAFTPDYHWIEVNGPGCGPRCLQGSDEIILW